MEIAFERKGCSNSTAWATSGHKRRVICRYTIVPFQLGVRKQESLKALWAWEKACVHACVHACIPHVRKLHVRMRTESTCTLMEQQCGGWCRNVERVWGPFPHWHQNCSNHRLSAADPRRQAALFPREPHGSIKAPEREGEPRCSSPSTFQSSSLYSGALSPASACWGTLGKSLNMAWFLFRPLILGEVGRWLRYLAIHLPPPCPSWTLNDLGIVPLLLWAWLPHQHNESIGQKVSNDPPPPPNSMTFSWDHSPLLWPLPSPVTSRHPGPRCEGNGGPREAILPVICPYQIAPAVPSP